MDDTLLVGQKVALVAIDPETYAENFTKWSRNTNFMRLLDSDPAILWNPVKTREMYEKKFSKEEDTPLMFGICTLDDRRVIGFIDLDDIRWNHGDAWVAIGIGDEADWSKGDGADAINILLRFAFEELNLRRVSLDVFETNPRAQRAYEKVGFTVEGTMHDFMLRDGQRWNMTFMGILREEWEKLNPAAVG